MKNLKWLFLPITLLLWSFITYFCMYLVYFLLIYVSNLSWLFLIFGFIFILMILGLFASGIPSITAILITKLYKSKVANILHGIVGLISLILFISFVFSDPSIESLKENYTNNKWKMIILFFPFLGFIISSIYTSISIGFINKLKVE